MQDLGPRPSKLFRTLFHPRFHDRASRQSKLLCMDVLGYQEHLTIIRINAPLSSKKLAQLNEKFQDILISGSIEQVDANEIPYDNHVFLHLPRLVMHSQKASFGKVYAFIHYLNLL